MGLGSVMAAVGAATAKGIASAVSNSKSSSSGGASSSGGSSSGSASGNSGSSTVSKSSTTGTAASTAQPASSVYKVGANGAAETGIQYKTGDKIVTNAGTYTVTGVNADGGITGRSAVDKAQTAYNYTGSYANPHDGSNIGTKELSVSAQSVPGSTTQGAYTDALSGYNSAYSDALSQYQQAQTQNQAAIQAKIQQNVNDLSAQKSEVQKAGATANQSAYNAYMQVTNPNGGLAESLAARGLLPSGLTESSLISAGNTYQNAVNDNGETVQTQLAEIERAIVNAQLQGDSETATALASYAEKVADAGLQRAQQIAALKQWQTENEQAQKQQNKQNGYTEAELTGTYNGQPTLAGQAQQNENEAAKFRNQLSALTLQIQKAYGMSQAQAEYAYQLLQNEGQKLLNQGYNADNVGKYLQNNYQKIVNAYYGKST